MARGKRERERESRETVARKLDCANAEGWKTKVFEVLCKVHNIFVEKLWAKTSQTSQDNRILTIPNIALASNTETCVFVLCFIFLLIQSCCGLNCVVNFCLLG